MSHGIEFARYGQEWIAVTPLGCVTIRKRGVGWEFHGPGFGGYAGSDLSAAKIKASQEFVDKVKITLGWLEF